MKSSYAEVIDPGWCSSPAPHRLMKMPSRGTLSPTGGKVDYRDVMIVEGTLGTTAGMLGYGPVTAWPKNLFLMWFCVPWRPNLITGLGCSA